MHLFVRYNTTVSLSYVREGGKNRRIITIHAINLLSHFSVQRRNEDEMVDLPFCLILENPSVLKMI